MSTLYIFVAPASTKKTTLMHKFFSHGTAVFAEFDLDFYPVLDKLDAGYDSATTATPQRLAEQKEHPRWEDLLQRHAVVVLKIEQFGQIARYPK